MKQKIPFYISGISLHFKNNCLHYMQFIINYFPKKQVSDKNAWFLNEFSEVAANRAWNLPLLNFRFFNGNSECICRKPKLKLLKCFLNVFSNIIFLLINDKSFHLLYVRVKYFTFKLKCLLSNILFLSFI